MSNTGGAGAGGPRKRRVRLSAFPSERRAELKTEHPSSELLGAGQAGAASPEPKPSWGCFFGCWSLWPRGLRSG